VRVSFIAILNELTYICVDILCLSSLDPPQDQCVVVVCVRIGFDGFEAQHWALEPGLDCVSWLWRYAILLIEQVI